jgi:hypothetical protein
LISHSKSVVYAENVALRLKKIGRKPTNTTWVLERHNILVGKRPQWLEGNQSSRASPNSFSRSTAKVTPQYLPDEDDKNSPEVEDSMESDKLAVESPGRKRLRSSEDIYRAEERSKDRSNYHGMTTRRRYYEREGSPLSVQLPQEVFKSVDDEAGIAEKLDHVIQNVRRQE